VDWEAGLWVLIGVACGILGLLAAGWAGLHVGPEPFPPFDAPGADLGTFPLPDGLPEPVERYYRAVCGDEAPRVGSAVVSGRARLRVFGICFPGRFRFVHRAGHDYRHYIELTLFGWPILRVNEFYLDGESRLELPFGVSQGEPKVAQAANLGLWGESFWFPSILLSDSRVRWEAVDRETAHLVVPFGEVSETFTVRFDAQTDRVVTIEAMRYKSEKAVAKTRWVNRVVGWTTQGVGGMPAAVRIAWEDERSAWAEFRVQELVLNADVETFVRKRGP
jgi:hypothetical protein